MPTFFRAAPKRGSRKKKERKPDITAAYVPFRKNFFLLFLIVLVEVRVAKSLPENVA